MTAPSNVAMNSRTRFLDRLPRAKLRAYWAFATIAVRQRLGERATLASRAAFLGLLVLIYDRLWRAVLPAGAAASTAAGPTEYVWYLAITEWITLAPPWLHLDIERDVRSGEVVCQLTRPLPYVGAKLAEAMGTLALNVLVLGVAAIGFAYVLSGGLPRDPRGLWLALPLGALASMLAVLFRALIGLSAFWIVDSSPLNWVWQKAMFLLGGLFVPLDLYPDWLRALASATPFAAMLYEPGRCAFGFDPARAAHAFGVLLGWTAAALAAVAIVHRRALHALDVRGG
jgi:ABC-2 type transport system permease protein